MPVFRVGHRNIYFAHVPKCGGTSIEYALAAADVELGFIDESLWREKSRLWYKSSPQHITERDLSRLLPPSMRDYEFAIVRDPVARFISAFNHNRRARRIPFFFTIERFLSKIERRQDFYGYDMDNHFVPANRFVSETCDVFHLEGGLDRVADRLLEVTDGQLRIVPKHQNARGLNDPTSQTLARTLVKKYLMPRIPGKDDLPSETVRRIKNLYAEDYDRFHS